MCPAASDFTHVGISVTKTQNIHLVCDPPMYKSHCVPTTKQQNIIKLATLRTTLVSQHVLSATSHTP